MHRISPHAVVLMIAIPVCSQDPGPAGTKKLTLTTGVIASMLPEYQGSVDNRKVLFPMIQVDYRNRILFGPNSTGTGAGVAFRTVLASRFTWDVDLSAEGPRYEKRAAALAGMGDHDVSMWAGTGITFRANGFSAKIGGMRGLKDESGSKGQLAIGYQQILARRWVLSIQTAAQVSDSQNAIYEFGISPEQSQRRTKLLAAGEGSLKPGDEAVYLPGSGLTSVKVDLSGTYILDSHWSAMAALSINSLQGDARRSPLTKRPTNTTTALGMMYRF